MLGAVLCAQALDYILIAKHPAAQYALPALSLMGLNLALSVWLLQRYFTILPKYTSAFTATLALALCGGLYVHAQKKYKHQKHRGVLCKAQEQLLKNLPPEINVPPAELKDATIICPLWFASIPGVLDYGSQYNLGKYAAELRALYPRVLIYRQPMYYKSSKGGMAWKGTQDALFHFDQEISDADFLELVRREKVFMFLNKDWDLPNRPGVTWEMLRQEPQSSLWRAHAAP